MKLKSILLFLALVPNICKADLTDFVSYDDTNKEQIKMYINEVYRRYPETREMKLEDNHDSDFILSIIRSVLAEKVYEEYKSDFIKKFKAKSLSTGRKIMGYKQSSEKPIKNKYTGKNEFKYITTEVDFDNEIANLPNGVLHEFHLYEDYIDKKECWHNGDAATVSICKIPNDSEPFNISINETKEDIISKQLSFTLSDNKNNTSNYVTVTLEGKVDILDKNKSVSMLLDVVEDSLALSDRLNFYRQTHYSELHNKDRVTNTPYDEAVTKANWYIESTTIDLVHEYNKTGGKK